MNASKLQSAISSFVKNKKTNVAYYDENWAERKERKSYYQEWRPYLCRKEHGCAADYAPPAGNTYE